MASWLAGGRSSEAEIYESAEVMQGNKMKNKIVLQFLVSVFFKSDARIKKSQNTSEQSNLFGTMAVKNVFKVSPCNCNDVD